MSDLINQVENLEENAKKLIYLQKTTFDLNKKLINERVEFLKQLELYKNQITKLEEEIKILKTAKTISGKGNIEAKNKINEIVREIDKCVSLLNN